MRDASVLTSICRRHNVILLTAFGSALDPHSQPHDLDVGVLFDFTKDRDVLGLLDELSQVARFDSLDVTVLNDAGPVIRERALVGAEVLFEGAKSVHANASIAAIMERLDTAWLRRLALETMARPQLRASTC